MVAGGAAAVDRLTSRGAQGVDLTGVGERLQGAVDGGEPDCLSGAAQGACNSWALRKPSAAAMA